MSNFKIGISIGDLNGIGPEVVLKALSDERMLGLFTPVVYGSAKAMVYHRNILDGEAGHFQGISEAEQAQQGRINVVDCWQEQVDITLGKATEAGGKHAYIALDRAVRDLKKGLLDALVTAPINKEAMRMADFPHAGHTEFLAQAAGGVESLMLLVNDGLRVGLVTNHLALRDVAEAITKERVLSKIMLMHKTLREDFGLERPKVAVLGLNPHAGDGGVMGAEEAEIIRPAIAEASKKGVLAFGPFPADGFFGSSDYQQFDAILAMYHDQGLVPFKALSFGQGVNFTAGLPFVRTSPDHGTAYALAGKNRANADSFRQALYLAKDVAKNRKAYREDRANAVQRVKVRSERQPK